MFFSIISQNAVPEWIFKPGVSIGKNILEIASFWELYWPHSFEQREQNANFYLTKLLGTGVRENQICLGEIFNINSEQLLSDDCLKPNPGDVLFVRSADHMGRASMK